MNLATPETLCDDEAMRVPQLPALKTEIRSIVDARNAALAKMQEAAETLEQAYALSKEAERLASKAHMGRKFYGLDRSDRDDFKALFRDRFELEASVETYRQQTPKHLAFRRWAERANGGRAWGLFTDLPAESFAEAGTRIDTVILSLRR